MAKQPGFFKFKGKLGGVIGYEVNGEYYLRSMPEQVRRSSRTKRSGQAFGKASRLGAVMRHAMSGVLDGLTTAGLGNRLNTALVGVLQADDLHAHKRFVPAHFRKLQSMELNTHAALSSLLPVTPPVTRAENGCLTVTIPAMEHFGHNPRATHISVKAIAVFVQPSYQQATAEASAPVP